MPKIAAPPDANTGRRRGRRVTSSLSEINVVPLVDVMLVLLIIFMVTAPMIQRGIDVRLPVSRRASTVEGERVFVTVPATYRTDGMVYVGSDRVTMNAMKELVKQKLATNDDKQVYLRGDGAVTLQELMRVFDSLRDAGVTNVGFVTKAPGEI